MRGKVVCSIAVLFMFYSVQVNASLNTGALATDFSLTDINGTSYSLSEMLAQGKKVIVNFGAAWSPSSWKYAYSNTLNDVNSLYGEDGLNNVVILYIESDVKTSDECIRGQESCNSSSMGDWTSMLNYPIINLTEEEASLLGIYQIDKYPTIYGISTDWKITNLGQANHAKILSWMYGEQAMHASVNGVQNQNLSFFSSLKEQREVKFYGSKAAVSTSGISTAQYYSNLMMEVKSELNDTKRAADDNPLVASQITTSDVGQSISNINVNYLFP